MKKKTTFFITAVLIVTSCFGQNEDGYWDNFRAFTRQISLEAGKKTWVRVELPVGTTDVAYRITLGSSKVSSSLANALGSVPEPHAQGASAAIKLLVAVGGDDKCNCFIFLTGDDANKFYSDGTFSNSCFTNYNIPGDAGILTQNTCLSSSPTFLYFGFKNLNWIENEKITLETVPWVDKKASRGWTKELKEEAFKSLKSLLTSGGANKYMHDGEIDELAGCVLSKITQKYTRQELTQYADYEFKKIAKENLMECDKELGLNLDNRGAINPQTTTTSTSSTEITNTLPSTENLIGKWKDDNSSFTLNADGSMYIRWDSGSGKDGK